MSETIVEGFISGGWQPMRKLKGVPNGTHIEIMLRQNPEKPVVYKATVIGNLASDERWKFIVKGVTWKRFRHHQSKHWSMRIWRVTE